MSALLSSSSVRIETPIIASNDKETTNPIPLIGSFVTVPLVDATWTRRSCNAGQDWASWEVVRQTPRSHLPQQEGEGLRIHDRSRVIAVACLPRESHPLKIANEDLIGRLNQAIASGVVKDRGGEPVQAPIEGGLVREDGTVLYPIIDAVPVMLVDRGISLQGSPSPDEQNR